jgi:hypothetical protein
MTDAVLAKLAALKTTRTPKLKEKLFAIAHQPCLE